MTLLIRTIAIALASSLSVANVGCGSGGTLPPTPTSPSSGNIFSAGTNANWNATLQSSGALNIGSTPGDAVTALAAAADGGVVAFGYSLGSFPGAPNPLQTAAAVIHKINTDGQLEWTRNVTSVTGDFGISGAVAPDGTVIIASARTESSTTTVCVVTAFTSLGARLWQTRLPLTGARALPVRLQVRGTSEVLILGTRSSGSGQDMFLTNLALQDGSQQASRTWGDATSFLSPTDFAVNANSGALSILGQSATPFPSGAQSGTHTFIVTVNAMGGQTWLNERLPGNALATALGILPSGEPVLGGAISSDTPPLFIAGLGTTMHVHSALWKLSASDGSATIMKEFTSGAGDQVSSLAVARNGSVFAVGSTFGAFNPQFAAAQNRYLLKLDSTLNAVSVRQFGSGEVIGKAVPFGPCAAAGDSVIFTATTIQVPLGSSTSSPSANTSWLISKWSE